MHYFLPALSLFLLVACGGDEGVGFNAVISSPQNGSSITELQDTLLEGVISTGDKPIGNVESSWWSGQRVLCKWAKLGENGASSCESKLRGDEKELTLLARIPGLAGLLDVETSATISLNIIPKENSPVCEFVEPSGDWGMVPGTTLDIQANVRIPDSSSQGKSVQWSSDLDGVLGESTVGQDGAVEFALSDLSTGLHQFSMELVSTEQGTCKTSIQLGVGPAPVIKIDASKSTLDIVEGESFRSTATVTHTESVILTWLSDLDGDLKTRTIRSGGVSNIEIDTLSAGTHQISAVGFDSFGVPGKDSVEVEVFGVPTAPVIKLEPKSPFTTDDLEVLLLVDSADHNGLAVEHRIEWWVDGRPYLKDDTRIPAEATSSGEIWEVMVWGETEELSGHVARAEVTIGGFVGWGQQLVSFASSDVSIVGEDTMDSAGSSLSSGCDLDGDGLDDLLVGAPGNDEGGSNSGRAYVIRGADIVQNSLLQTYYQKESLIGESAGDMSASALACGGDVDGDGTLDMLVASPGYEHSMGRTYLVLGSTFSGDFDLVDADVIVDGENRGDLSGSEVSFVGDVDGDGLSDVLVGSWANDDGGILAGKVYLLPGASLADNKIENLADADGSWIGEDSGYRAGHSVSGLGDVDGDGLDDIGFGAYGFDDGGASDYMGAVYVILSSSQGMSTPNQGAEQADITLLGEDSSHYAGYDLSGHGDVDNDGLDDFLVSSLGHSSSTGDGGAVYLVTASDLQTGTMSLSDSSYVFEGELAGDNVGRSIASAGDVDRDGFPDILIGAPSVGRFKPQGGQAYLLLNADIGTPGIMNLSQASYIFTAANGHELAGRQVASGDFNGDGMMDLAVGAPNAGSTSAKRGYTYLNFAQ